MSRRVAVLVHHFQFYVTQILNFVVLLCGKTEKDNFNQAVMGIFVAHEPGGTSVNSVKHWIQTYRNGKFRKFDYGKAKNLKIHGNEVPPEYSFTHLKSFPYRTHIFRG
jgi:hypothetical protein